MNNNMKIHLSDMKKAESAHKRKSHYTAPEVELLSVGTHSNLLNNFSGNTETWEDDEVITPQG